MVKRAERVAKHVVLHVLGAVILAGIIARAVWAKTDAAP